MRRGRRASSLCESDGVARYRGAPGAAKDRARAALRPAGARSQGRGSWNGSPDRVYIQPPSAGDRVAGEPDEQGASEVCAQHVDALVVAEPISSAIRCSVMPSRGIVACWPRARPTAARPLTTRFPKPAMMTCRAATRHQAQGSGSAYRYPQVRVVLRAQAGLREGTEPPDARRTSLVRTSGGAGPPRPADETAGGPSFLDYAFDARLLGGTT